VERVGFAMEGSKLIRYSFSVGYIIFMLILINQWNQFLKAYNVVVVAF
jgi:hypothetical protein